MDRRIELISEELFQKLIDLSKHFMVRISETNGFEQAQVCAGGVKLSDVNPDTLESKYVDRLYITGELLDVDAICGGYNLQWAWSTGYIAAIHATKEN
jgi:predicted flavoprotein YhiN